MSEDDKAAQLPQKYRNQFRIIAGISRDNTEKMAARKALLTEEQRRSATILETLQAEVRPYEEALLISAVTAQENQPRRPWIDRLLSDTENYQWSSTQGALEVTHQLRYSRSSHTHIHAYHAHGLPVDPSKDLNPYDLTFSLHDNRIVRVDLNWKQFVAKSAMKLVKYPTYDQPRGSYGNLAEDLLYRFFVNQEWTVYRQFYTSEQQLSLGFSNAGIFVQLGQNIADRQGDSFDDRLFVSKHSYSNRYDYIADKDTFISSDRSQTTKDRLEKMGLHFYPALTFDQYLEFLRFTLLLVPTQEVTFEGDLPEKTTKGPITIQTVQ